MNWGETLNLWKTLEIFLNKVMNASNTYKKKIKMKQRQCIAVKMYFLCKLEVTPANFTTLDNRLTPLLLIYLPQLRQ